jgi:VWFA-related protein
VRFYAAVLAALFALPAAAQFSETLEVRLLEIEATVVDREQRTIDGLTREDFSVTIDGQPAAITNFAAVSRGVIREATSSTAPSAEVVELPVPTRLIIIVDDLHLRPEPKKRALRALRRYVQETMDAATTATLITWNGALTARTTPTTRRDLLLSAIDASEREIPRGMAIDAERRQLEAARRLNGYPQMVRNYAASRAEDARRTLGALEDVVENAARAIEGRKLVLFISEGVPLHPAADLISALSGSRTTRIQAMEYAQGPRFQAFANQAQAAGVIFTTIDPSATAGMHEGGMGDVDLTIDTGMTRRLSHEGVALLARETGGTVVADQNDLDRALTRLDERLSTYYSLAVRPPASAARNPRVEVRVKDQPKLRVHVATRSGLPSRDEAIANAVRAQLSRRTEENPLHVRLFVQPEQHPTGCIAALQFLVPAEKLALLPPASETRGQLDVWFAVVDQSGVESAVKMQPVTITARHGATIGHMMPLALTRGEYVISTAVVDRLSGASSYLQREVDCGAE